MKPKSMSIVVVATLAGLLLAGCTRCSRDEGQPVQSQAEPTLTVEGAPPAPRAEAGFLPETPEQPLVQSTLDLEGVKLGTGIAEARAHLARLGVGVRENWSEQDVTGLLSVIPAGGQPDEDGLRQEIAYLQGGELVGYQRLVDVDRAGFDAQVEALIARHGQPVTDAPYYVTAHNFYYLFDNEKTGELLFWLDESTRTVLAASLSKDESQSVWVLFHPERLDRARGETYSTAGS